MKKLMIRLVVFAAIFLLTLVVAGNIMNQGHDNMTMEMAEASLPIVSVERGGVRYNELHGYTVPMETFAMREAVTVLEENRNFSLYIDLYGRNVTGMSIELRSTDGTRLVESTEITSYQTEGNRAYADITLKDLIDPKTEYALKITLMLDDDTPVDYYTRVVWSDDLKMEEKLSFGLDFHNRLFDREAAKELTKYLETNAQLEDNASFHKVNIHSSFRQLTWGNLDVRQQGDTVVRLTEIGEQTASFLLYYTVYGGSGEDRTDYRVVEHYRVRYTTDRMYLLNYERTMTQIPNPDRMVANDKILLGITGTDIPLMESEDGSSVVFVVDGQLYSYNATNNKLTILFGFYDQKHMDARDMYDEHAIKILDVDEGQNVSFAVYGYMNRGRHEGEVGTQLYTYNSATNTIEETIYIPYDKGYAMLKPQMEKLLYLNRDQNLYLMLEDVVYVIDLEEKTYYPMASVLQSDMVQVSDNHHILAWQEGSDLYHSKQLHIKDLNTEIQQDMTVTAEESVRLMGFMGEDIIYGVARNEDVYRENSGRIFFPMYKLCICDAGGNLLKEYSQEEIYVTDCSVESNQITLERVKRQANGAYVAAATDQIMNSVEEEVGKYTIVAPAIDTYERYVQIQTRRTIDSKTLQVLTPKEVVFEGGRERVLETDTDAVKYYVYGAYGVEGIYSQPSKAVSLANEVSGVVVNRQGNVIWRKGNRAQRNQIMAITAIQTTEEQNSLAQCLNTMLKYEGITRNAEYLLEQGQTVMEVLQNNLEHIQVLDLNGCELDAMLYYVDRDIPVLALLDDGGAVLITGYNEYNVVVMDPAKGTLAKMGMNDAAEWLKKNGNNFVTYSRE